MKALIIVLSLGYMGFAMNAYGEERHFRSSDSTSVSEGDRAQIESILKKYRLLGEKESIADAEKFRGFLGLPDITIPDPRTELCKAACDVSMAAAVAACTGLSSGTAAAACSAAAVIARDSCKKGC